MIRETKAFRNLDGFNYKCFCKIRIHEYMGAVVIAFFRSKKLSVATSFHATKLHTFIAYFKIKYFKKSVIPYHQIKCFIKHTVKLA